MMTKLKTLWARRAWRRAAIGLAGVALVAGGLGACGHRPDHGRWSTMSPEQQAEMRTKAVERLGSKLDLDAAQRARLATLVERLQAQRGAVMGAADPRAAVQALVAGPTFDRAGARAFVEGKADAVRNASPQVIEAFGDFYDSLKPAQQQQVRDFIAQGRRHGWHRG